jgi:hypothetical protein
MDHYYVYYYRNGSYYYERTCGTQESAQSRVDTIKKWKDVKHATYTINHLIKGAFH